MLLFLIDRSVDTGTALLRRTLQDGNTYDVRRRCTSVFCTVITIETLSDTFLCLSLHKRVDLEHQQNPNSPSVPSKVVG